MSNPKLSTLQDPFDEAALNTSVWGATTGGATTFDAANNLVELAVGTVANTYNNLGTSGYYDATSSSVSAQITPAPAGNGTITILKLAADANNGVELIVNSANSAFYVILITGGTYTSPLTLPNYNPHLHRWWEISESGGSLTFSTSADGLTWVPQGSVPYTWNATAVQVFIQTGTSVAQPSGLAATIANVNTMSGGPVNLDFPVIETAWGAHWNANGGDVPLDRYVDISTRTRDAVKLKRGRQYELDEIQAGTLDATLANNDSVLDPNNTSGPYYGNIDAYQPLRVRAQWPPTRNLLTQVQATGGDLGGQSLGTINDHQNGPSIFSSTDTTGGSFVASSSAFMGATVMQFAVPTTTTANQSVVYTPQPAVLPGQAYATSVWVRNVAASGSVQVCAALRWYDLNQTLISNTLGTTTTLTGSTTAAWTPMSVSGIAPANAAMMYVSVYLVAVPTVAATVQVDAWQLEHGTTASAWCCPGVWSPMYGGFSERWTSSWIMSGTYGVVKPTGVDALALLSQVKLKDPLTNEINSHGTLRYLYPLADPAGSQNAADWSGTNPVAPLINSKDGSGSLTFGNPIKSASSPATSYAFTGAAGPVMTVNNPNPGTNVISAATMLSLSGANIKGPTASAWTRMIAFRYTGPTPTVQAVLWSTMDAINSSNRDQMALYIGSGSIAGQVQLYTNNYTNSNNWNFGTVNCADSNWHLAIWSYDPVAQNLTLALDNQWGYYSSVTQSEIPTSFVGDNVGGWYDPATAGGAAFNYQGDIAFVGEFNSALSGSDMMNLYAAWRSACLGESTDARYARILRYSGFLGNTNLQPGMTTSMGPATDINGTDALSALQAVVLTENGDHFIDAAGTITFQARSARYNAITPAVVFGEDVEGGEWPYEECELDFDPTHLSNLHQITQTSTGQVFTAQDSPSQKKHFTRTLQRDLNVTNPLEAQDAANYLLSRYKSPLTRVNKLKLHPSAYPAMWGMCLSLELGQRVRVMRRPNGGQPVQADQFIEQIEWSWDAANEATITLMCSPADTTPYGVMASFHTTVATAASSGATSITINAGADNTNPAAAQLCSGQQLVLGYGTANQETVTIAPQGLPVTTSGWTTVVVPLTAATTHAHAAGDVVCEVLPSGVTNPANWDTVSEIGSIALSY